MGIVAGEAAFYKAARCHAFEVQLDVGRLVVIVNLLASVDVPILFCGTSGLLKLVFGGVDLIAAQAFVVLEG
jgi:hypothetical protein